MIIEGLGTGNILERNIYRINYVTKLSNNKKQVETLVDELIMNLSATNYDGIKATLVNLFHEEIYNYEIDELVSRFSKLDNVSKFRNEMMNKCIERPKRGFVWNCYTLVKN